LGKGGGGKRGVNGRDDGWIDGWGGRNGNNRKQCRTMQLLLGKTKTWTTTRAHCSSSPSLSEEEEEGKGGRRGIDGGGVTPAAEGAAVGASPSPAAPATPLSVPPLARQRRVRWDTAVTTAHRQGSRSGFPGPIWGGERPAAVAAGATVPWCRCPPGAAPPPPPCSLDGPTMTKVMTAPARQPAAMSAMATPSRTLPPLPPPPPTRPPPPPLLPAKQTMRGRRMTTMVAETRTTTRTTTCGGGHVVQLILLLIVIGCRPPCQQCHCHSRLAAVGNRGAQD
jgi:hypothetical protein